MASAKDRENYEKEREFIRELLIACEKDELGRVKELDQQLKSRNTGVSISDYKDGRKSGAVHAAARGGAKDTLEFLLSLRPEQGGMRDSEGRTPLIAACSSENGAACVKFLLESNPAAKETVNAESNETRAIHFAASLDHDDSLRLLLDLGRADPNSPSSAGLPIHWAAGHSSTAQTLKALLDTGKVDVNAKDPQGCTPIILAAMRGKPELVQCLCDAGADLKVFVQNLGVLGAAAAGGSKRCVEIILEKGGNELCLIRDPVENLLPVDVAAHSGHEDIVELLGPLSGLKGVSAAELIREAKEEHEKQIRKAAEEQRAADEAAGKLKEAGNKLFAQQKFSEAIEEYNAALVAAGEKASGNMRATIHSNMSACYLKLNLPEQARVAAEQATTADPTFAKGQFRLGQACSALKDHQAAAQAFWDAYNIDKKASDAATFLNLFKKEIDSGKIAYQQQQQANARQ